MTHFTASELFRAGKLTEALVAAKEAVKKQPTDTNQRAYLAQLLCFSRDWERADQHWETVIQQDPQAAISGNLLRQLIRAEVARQQFFAEGRLPEFLVEPSAVIQLHLRASIAIREREFAEAVELLGEAEKQRPRSPGTCDGVAFEDFRDLDDLTAPALEVLTSTGKYYWLSIDCLNSLDFFPTERPQDLLWRHARVSLKGEQEGDVYLPAVYPLTSEQTDDQLRLGRATHWLDVEGQPVRGLGQRTFLAGEEAKAILEIRHLEFRTPS